MLSVDAFSAAGTNLRRLLMNQHLKKKKNRKYNPDFTIFLNQNLNQMEIIALNSIVTQNHQCINNRYRSLVQKQALILSGNTTESYLFYFEAHAVEKTKLGITINSVYSVH